MSEDHLYLELENRRTRLSPGEQTIGRSHRCGIVVANRSVSRTHAMISVANGRVTLQDLNSSNGTFVNGELLRGETELRDGDEILLGEAEARLSQVPATYSEPLPFDELSAAIDARLKEHEEAPATRVDPERFSRSEAISSPEVLPAGELLAVESGSRATTRRVPRPNPAATQPALSDTAADGSHSGTFGAPELGQGGEPTSVSEVLPSLDELDAIQLPPRDAGAAGSRVVPAAGSTEGQEAFEFPEPHPMHLEAIRAGFGSRLAAGLFDFVGVAAFALVFSVAGERLIGFAATQLTYLAVGLLSTLIGILCWSIWGATPGQRFVGLVVTDREGRSPISVTSALARGLACWLTAATFGLGFLMVLFNRRSLALHDVLSATRVQRR